MRTVPTRGPSLSLMEHPEIWLTTIQIARSHCIVGA